MCIRDSRTITEITGELRAFDELAEEDVDENAELHLISGVRHSMSGRFPYDFDAVQDRADELSPLLRLLEAAISTAEYEVNSQASQYETWGQR